MKYTVKNICGIAGETHHRKPETAVKAAKKRKGDRWIVVDEHDVQWWVGEDGKPFSVNYDYNYPV